MSVNTDKKYIIKLIITTPQSEYKSFWRTITVPEKKVFAYYSGERFWRGFKGAKTLTKKEAQDILKQEKEDDDNKYALNIDEASKIYTGKLLTERVEQITEERKNKEYEILCLDQLYNEYFDTAFPFDEQYIPEIDRDVEFIYRDGSRTGVVTNFLRGEMLNGNMLSFNPHFLRWRYIPDSIYLKLKRESCGNN